MSLTTFANQKVQNALWQAAALGNPATWYVGLLVGTKWATSQTWTLHQVVYPTTFNSISGQQGKIFICTTAGAGSTTTEPTWPTTEGGTVTDNAAVFTEASLLFQGGTFYGEVVGNNYSRVAVTANATNFGNATSAEPCVTQNATAISFASPSADWGFVVGVIMADASTAGNIWDWGAMTSALDCPSGSTPSIGVNGLSLSISALLTA